MNWKELKINIKWLNQPSQKEKETLLLIGKKKVSVAFMGSFAPQENNF